MFFASHKLRARFRECLSRFLFHAFVHEALSELYSRLCVLRVKVCDLAEDFQSLARLPVALPCFCNDHVLMACVNNESLTFIKHGELVCYLRAAGIEAVHLPVHRYGFALKALFAVMFGDAQEALHGFLFVVLARVEVAEHVERREILRIVLNNLAILFYGCGDFPLGKILLSRTQNLCLVESHWESLKSNLDCGAEPQESGERRPRSMSAVNDRTCNISLRLLAERQG